jgi:hypothetical protein
VATSKNKHLSRPRVWLCLRLRRPRFGQPEKTTLCKSNKVVWLGATAGGQKNQVLACHALVTKIEQERGLSPIPNKKAPRSRAFQIFFLSAWGAKTSRERPQIKIIRTLATSKLISATNIIPQPFCVNHHGAHITATNRKQQGTLQTTSTNNI